MKNSCFRKLTIEFLSIRLRKKKRKSETGKGKLRLKPEKPNCEHWLLELLLQRRAVKRNKWENVLVALASSWISWLTRYGLLYPIHILHNFEILRNDVIQGILGFAEYTYKSRPNCSQNCLTSALCSGVVFSPGRILCPDYVRLTAPRDIIPASISMLLLPLLILLDR